MPKVFSGEQENKIKTFINLALDFNKTHNIFSRESYDEVYENDILDCKPLINYIKKNESVLDLGSGGGFPGILLSITRPENKISLLESSNKKCYFLKKASHELNLKNVEIINTTIFKNNNLGRFDIITSRAFAPIKKTMTLTKQNTKPSTKYLLLKGTRKKTTEEVATLNKNQYSYKIINKDTKRFERNLVIITLK